MMRHLVLICMLSSLSVSIYYWMNDEANATVLKCFRYGDSQFKHYENVRAEFRPRIGSTLLANRFYTGNAREMKRRIAVYFSYGFLVTGLLYMLIDSRAAPLLMLGTFAGLYYCSTPKAGNVWYPWDMPALVFGAATLLLATRRTVFPLALTVLVAAFFKETLLLMALFFLFYEGRSRRWRLAWSGGVVAAGIFLRSLIVRFAGSNPDYTAFLHVVGDPDREYRFVRNLNYMFSAQLNHVLWVNVGMWLLVFFIPTRDPVLAGFKWITAAFYLGLLMAGSFTEFRVFLEALPGTLLLVHQLFDRETALARAA